MTQYTGGGGGKPTLLKINTNIRTKLFCWTDGNTNFYILNEKPSVYEPLYNWKGELLSDCEIYGKSGDVLTIRNKTNNNTFTITRNKSSDKKLTLQNGTFYKNGGGGSGAKGEDWALGAKQRVRKGAAGGGYYYLDTDNLNFISVNGRDAGLNVDSLAKHLFPDVHSGKGGASGIDSGATPKSGKTNYKQGIGASGANSALNSYAAQDDAYFGSGGGGAGGDEDASGGKAGDGDSTYVTNTTGEDGYNFHSIPTYVPDALVSDKHGNPKIITDLGRGGIPYTDGTQTSDGNHGWIYIYKFEKVNKVYDMGNIASDIPVRTIDARYVNEPIDPDDPEQTMDGGTDFDTSNYLNAGIIVAEEPWDFGDIEDTNITEVIKMGGI